MPLRFFFVSGLNMMISSRRFKNSGRNARRSSPMTAARALSVACAVIQTPTNALGFSFYSAAASAYHQAGLTETAQTYDRLADAEFENILASLQAAAVPDEPNPVKIDWNC